MIVEWFMQMSGGFLDWLATLFPPVELPEWVEHPFDGVDAIVGVVVGAGTWVDFVVLGGVALAVLAVYVVGVGIRLVRAIIAHIPAIGGGG